MPYKHKRDCPVCDKPGLLYMSNHLHQVHHLYGDKRKKWLGRARSQFHINTALVYYLHARHILFVYEGQKTICIFWYYNQWQECYEELKKSLKKASGLKEVCPKCRVKLIPCITTSSS